MDFKKKNETISENRVYEAQNDSFKYRVDYNKVNGETTRVLCQIFKIEKDEAGVIVNELHIGHVEMQGNTISSSLPKDVNPSEQVKIFEDFLKGIEAPKK